ncbi:MAG: hypothetical protein ACMUIU_14290 [bacterium]
MRLSVPKGAAAVTVGAAVGIIIVAAAARGNVGRIGYGLNTGLKIGAERVGNGRIKGLKVNG